MPFVLRREWYFYALFEVAAMERCKVTEDADRLAPDWLAVRINYKTIKFVYSILDGYSFLKGVRIDGQMAKIGDTICFDDNGLSVERR